MMNLNKMIAQNKKCACVAMTVIGAIAGWATAKLIITHCCCTQTLACKAKKAIKAVEDKMMP
ncbi:MAG: hypothetical protein J6Q89_07495 [Clostridia bacterium]|nr:hypothetical protein [Clostridia bacterium]MBQ4317353.1 hypothetical protein [Clostridia bacterium]